MEELGFYKNKAKYYEKSLEDLMQHYIDGCSMCTINLDCSKCVVDDFINQLRNILYEIFCIVVVGIKENIDERAWILYYLC